jgi:hypothetical protein
MAGADVIAAYCTGAAGIITAVGGVIIAWRTSRGAKMAAEDAARSSIRAEATINTVGKQVGQHAYEVRDRLNTEALRAETMQRNLERMSSRIPEESVSGYVRKAKAAQQASEDAARAAREALSQVNMMLGMTPTDRVLVHPMEATPPLKGPLPPPVPPLKGDD